MKSLEEQTRDLERATPPPAELWPVVERRIRARGRTARIAVAAAALAVTLVAGGLPLGLHLAREGRAGAAYTRFTTAAHAYEQAKARLLTALDAMAGELDPDVLGAVRRDLETLDLGVRDAVKAIGPDPGDPALALALAGQYDRMLIIVDGTSSTLARSR